MSNPVCHVCMCPILTLFSKTILQPNREFSCCSSLHFWLDEKRTQKGQNLHLALTFCSQTVTHDVPFCKIKTFVPQLIHTVFSMSEISYIYRAGLPCVQIVITPESQQSAPGPTAELFSMQLTLL